MAQRRIYNLLRLQSSKIESILHAQRPKIALRSRWQSTDARKDANSNIRPQQRPSRNISHIGAHLRRSLTAPMRVYSYWQGRRPYITQVISSMLIYTVGDLTAQYIEITGIAKGTEITFGSRDVSNQSSWLQQIDPARLGRTVITGAIISIPGYRWMMFLSNNFNLKSKLTSVAYKILINQFLYAPFIGTYFFSMQSLLSGQDLPSTVDTVLHTVPSTWQNSWKFWPFVMAANFTFIKPQNRSIFAIGAGIIWQTYLCIVNQQEVERSAQKQTQGVLAGI